MELVFAAAVSTVYSVVMTSQPYGIPTHGFFVCLKKPPRALALSGRPGKERARGKSGPERLNGAQKLGQARGERFATAGFGKHPVGWRSLVAAGCRTRDRTRREQCQVGTEDGETSASQKAQAPTFSPKVGVGSAPSPIACLSRTSREKQMGCLEAFERPKTQERQLLM